MKNTLSFYFGGEEKDRVEVQIHGYEREPTGEYFDDNWVNVSVHLSVGSFSGHYTATFLTSDFVSFHDNLLILHQSLKAIARFSTLEEQLSLELTGDGCGHITLKGLAIDAPGTGNRLNFELALDQSYLPLALRELHDIVSRFPVRTC